MDNSLSVSKHEKLQPLSRKTSVYVSQNHTFNTDTLLLASFSQPRAGETCADLGTGCGTLPLLWCDRSAPAHVYGVELQEEACALARHSVRVNELEGKIEIIRENIKSLKQTRLLPFNLDLIACNPPYKPNGTGFHSVRENQRIARHEIACSFTDIAETTASLLRWGGRFFCCMRPERLCDTLLTLRLTGLEPKRLRFVQQRKNKAPFLFLLQANRGGRPGLTVGPVLLIETEDGSLTPEMTEIYGDYKEGIT